MTLDNIKEEFRNKKVEVSTLTVSNLICLVVVDIAPLAGLFLLASCLFAANVGIKDWSSGRKLFGLTSHGLALLLFLFAGSTTIELDVCSEYYMRENSPEECRKFEESRSDNLRIIAGLCLLWFLFNPLLSSVYLAKPRRLGEFSQQFATTDHSFVPTRWYDKDADFEIFVLEEFSKGGIGSRRLYEWVCDVRGLEPEAYDSSVHYEHEASRLLRQAPWYSVYDLIQSCWPLLGYLNKDHFAKRVNEYLRSASLGWQFVDGSWNKVGDEVGTQNIMTAQNVCSDVGLEDAAEDLGKAWSFCNQPNPGLKKDAISAAMRALERVVQNHANQDGVSLNRIRWPADNSPHESLRGAINSLYRWSSEQARHAKEGSNIREPDAELIVHISAALIRYIVQRKLSEK